MTVNERAPVVATSELEIVANPDLVWEVLTAIDRWPTWNPDVKAASLTGSLAEGTVFRWKAGPGTITSTLLRVEPPRLIAWRGKTFGIAAIHVYQLQPRDGTTLVRSEESWEGLLVRIFRGRMQQSLQHSLDAGLRHLRTEAERRAAS
jgi:hypothetical protein